MYKAADSRYENMTYNRSGNSGLKLPAVSLGLWHNFGNTSDFENMKRMLLHSASVIDWFALLYHACTEKTSTDTR